MDAAYSLTRLDFLAAISTAALSFFGQRENAESGYPLLSIRYNSRILADVAETPPCAACARSMGFTFGPRV
ncbi:hypothetical protein [Ketogulonicigenium vulgare]|uniref:hypothetical protein n=1 Tax=Ketogulonicigenium vulgare TaxID=92945 RepID=UPI001305263F|nr:hypothetical protein [Ketogulonicigenium vulgare]